MRLNEIDNLDSFYGALSGNINQELCLQILKQYYDSLGMYTHSDGVAYRVQSLIETYCRNHGIPFMSGLSRIEFENSCIYVESASVYTMSRLQPVIVHIYEIENGKDPNDVTQANWFLSVEFGTLIHIKNKNKEKIVKKITKNTVCIRNKFKNTLYFKAFDS